MKITELVDMVSQKTGLSHAATTTICNTIFETITTAVIEGGDVTVHGFGKFYVKVRAARQGRNPRTNEPISIPETKAFSFKPASQLKKVIDVQDQG